MEPSMAKGEATMVSAWAAIRYPPLAATCIAYT